MRDLTTPSNLRKTLRKFVFGLTVALGLVTVFFAYVGFGGPGSPFNHCIHSADCADVADVRRLAILASGGCACATLILFGVGRYA